MLEADYNKTATYRIANNFRGCLNICTRRPDHIYVALYCNIITLVSYDVVTRVVTMEVSRVTSDCSSLQLFYTEIDIVA